jgi:hypothetical protein
MSFVCDECKIKMHAYHGIGPRVVVSDTSWDKISDKYRKIDDSNATLPTLPETTKVDVETKPLGVGDFSIGSTVWPGTSKVIEEMGELQQVLGKLIALAGDTKYWDGVDLRKRLIEEIGDLTAALLFFRQKNFTTEEARQVSDRIDKKLTLFREWDKNPTKP